MSLEIPLLFFRLSAFFFYLWSTHQPSSIAALHLEIPL